MRIYQKAFIPTLLVGMVVGTIAGYRVNLPLMLRQQDIPLVQIGAYLSVLGLVSFVMNPILLFVILYLLGKRVDLKSTYGGVSVSLFVGGALGHYFGYAAGYLITPMLRAVWTSAFAVAAGYFLSPALQLFFTGFTALALAYLRSLSKE